MLSKSSWILFLITVIKIFKDDENLLGSVTFHTKLSYWSSSMSESQQGPEICDVINAKPYWSALDCKTVGFFLKISKEISKAWRKSLTRARRASLTRPTGVWGERKKTIFSVSPQSRSLFSASFQTFCLTARAYLNTQKYGLFCSLDQHVRFMLHL